MPREAEPNPKAPLKKTGTGGHSAKSRAGQREDTGESRGKKNNHGRDSKIAEKTTWECQKTRASGPKRGRRGTDGKLSLKRKGTETGDAADWTSWGERERKKTEGTEGE